MARTQASKEVLSLSANWQAFFVAATTVGWLSQTLAVAIVLVSDYTSAGTWAFQITSWLLPVVMFGVALMLFAYYGSWLKRLFIASLASTIGMSLYTMFSIWEERLRNTYFPAAASPGDTSWWSAFGNEWFVMLVSLLVYAAVLYAVTQKQRR